MQGMFLGEKNTKLLELFDSAKLCLLLAQLGGLAGEVGNAERAEYWILRGIDAARAVGSAKFVSWLSVYALPYAIIRARFSEAVELSDSVGWAMVSARLNPDVRDAYDEDFEAFRSNATESLVKQVTERSVRVGVLPIVFRLLHLSITDTANIGSYAAQVEAGCRSLASRPMSSGVWTTIADLVKATFIEDASSKELVARGNALGRDEPLLQAVAYVCASAKHDGTLVGALMAHAYTLPSVYELCDQRNPSIYGDVVVQSVTVFWEYNVHAMRFAFSSPALVEQGLLEAREAPVPQRAQLIIRAIAGGLSVTLREEAVRKWVYGS